MTSTTYEHFNNGFNNSRNTIVEYGGYNLYHSLLEPTEEYKKSSPMLGMSMELVIIGDKVYTRNFVVPPTDTSDFNDSGPTSENSRVVLEMLFDIETLPDEEINGTDCYHYRGILDVEKYLEWFHPVYVEDMTRMNEASEMPPMDVEQGWKTMEIIYRSNEKIYEYWIGKDDYIIRKRILIDRKLLENPLPVDDLSHESTRQVITEYYDLNEEVIIEAPLDESGELLEGWVLTTLEE